MNLISFINRFDRDSDLPKLITKFEKGEEVNKSSILTRITTLINSNTPKIKALKPEDFFSFQNELARFLTSIWMKEDGLYQDCYHIRQSVKTLAKQFIEQKLKELTTEPLDANPRETTITFQILSENS